jgi:ABC-2 type transport system ATP-binding protein
MSNKWVNPQPKLVPQPYTNLLTERDIGKPPILETRHLGIDFGGLTAVADFNLAIGRTEITGLIGPNGAGKTTALKAVLGLIPFEGELNVLGRDPRTQRDDLMNDVCFIADVAVLPRWIRVSEAIEFVAGVHPRFDRAKCERFLANTQLNPKMRVREMSKGMIVQLHLALVMAIDAKLLVLDEPTLGLDILYRKQFYQRLLEDYFDEQKTIIITTHQVEEIEHILTDVMFIQNGKIVLDATMENLGDRFVEVLLGADRIEEARGLKPIDERSLPFGKTVMLFDNVPQSRLAALGETRIPGLADLFVATMKGTYA